MTDAVAVRGVVATSPRHMVPEAGAPITIFRLVTGEGVVDETSAAESLCGERNWYTVTATHQLALNAAACVARGDPLVVSGRLHVRDWQGELQGVTAEIEAQAIGHDLSWGSSVFTRFVAHAHHDVDEEVRGDRSGREP